MQQWRRSIQVLVALILFIGLLAPASLPARAQARVQPALLELAAEHPEQVVRVIVQKLASDDSVEALVAALGGKVTKDLHIIAAFAAELPAKGIVRLAQAPGVRWVSLDAPVASAAGAAGGTTPQNYYLDTLGVRQVWQLGLKGQQIGVAVIDSGISTDPDFTSLTRLPSFNASSQTINDIFGHGSHVAGIIGGNGAGSGSVFSGVAPGVNLISLKISDGTGMAYESDTVVALQWVYDNKAAYNIRVVNLSINATVDQSYHTSPLDAAAEILWFNGIVVVASAGNISATGGYNTINAAPANDPFIITVGASDEKGTTRRNDDVTASYSASGVTLDGFSKPDIVAPGTSIYSVLSKNSSWGAQYPDRTAYNGEYFRLSGTSMAAPMVAGAAALLLQDEPNLTPDQVKYRLVNTGSLIDTAAGRKPYLNVYAAVTGATTQSANTGLQASLLLWTGSQPLLWGSVNWNSVNWNSVNWNSVNWNSTYWGP